MQMNPDLKVLRVAVVPTETDNGINQSSTVEEILECEETQLFSVPDYFQAQNDSDIDLLHWSFLINVETNTDCTGINTDGIDMDNKASKIAYIKKVIGDWGNTSCAELSRDHSPCKASIGDGKQNVSELIEEFYPDRVSAITYNDEIEIGYNDYKYEDLEDYLIDEIVEIMEDYEADMEKTEKRCQN
jgi:hypothetical protein